MFRGSGGIDKPGERVNDENLKERKFLLFIITSKHVCVLRAVRTICYTIWNDHVICSNTYWRYKYLYYCLYTYSNLKRVWLLNKWNVHLFRDQGSIYVVDSMHVTTSQGVYMLLHVGLIFDCPMSQILVVKMQCIARIFQ